MGRMKELDIDIQELEQDINFLDIQYEELTEQINILYQKRLNTLELSNQKEQQIQDIKQRYSNDKQTNIQPTNR